MAMMMKRFLCVLPLCKMWWRQLGEELGQDLGIVSRWLWWPWVEGGVLLFGMEGGGSDSEASWTNVVVGATRRRRGLCSCSEL